jgi:hypothetical protein
MTADYVLDATRKLTGLDPERAREAARKIEGLGIAHLTEALVNVPTIDAAVAAVFLDESIDGLIEHEIERTKLVSKLRNDREVWPTWAELRAAYRIADSIEGIEIQLEPDRAQGRQADFRITFPGEGDVSIEFKALGLSEAEARFCQRARPTLEALKPEAGFVTLHAPLDTEREGIWLNREQRREGEREAVRLSRRLPAHTRGLSGAVVTAQGAEDAYVRRLQGRMTEAFGQLPGDHDCWVAFHWSNGAPFRLVSEALKNIDAPENLAGVAFIGTAVAFPHDAFHHFLMWAAYPQPEGEEGETLFDSPDEELGKLVFDRIDRSAGVRASVVRTSVFGERQPRDVLMRDGAQRILPYVLLIDPDPAEAIRESGLAITPRA